MTRHGAIHFVNDLVVERAAHFVLNRDYGRNDHGGLLLAVFRFALVGAGRTLLHRDFPKFFQQLRSRQRFFVRSEGDLA